MAERPVELRETDGAQATEALGAELAASLRPGDLVLVRGELGAGKTTLVRGALRALGVRDPVVSPTFTLARRYEGHLPIAHLDLYRLGETGALGAEDVELLEDYLTSDAIAFVEWPEHGPTALAARARREIELRHAGGDRRRVIVR